MSETIAKKLGLTEANKDDRVLIQWHRSYGRMGDVEGVFMSSRVEVAALDGKRWYLGEVLGKHSNVNGRFSADDFEILDMSKPLAVGFDPFNARTEAMNVYGEIEDEGSGVKP